MQANPKKFQAFIMGCRQINDTVFNIAGAEIQPSDSVKRLGVEIDNKLTSSKHISNICVKAGW